MKCVHKKLWFHFASHYDVKALLSGIALPWMDDEK